MISNQSIVTRPLHSYNKKRSGKFYVLDKFLMFDAIEWFVVVSHSIQTVVSVVAGPHSFAPHNVYECFSVCTCICVSFVSNYELNVIALPIRRCCDVFIYLNVASNVVTLNVWLYSSFAGCLPFLLSRKLNTLINPIELIKHRHAKFILHYVFISF